MEKATANLPPPIKKEKILRYSYYNKTVYSYQTKRIFPYDDEVSEVDADKPNRVTFNTRVSIIETDGSCKMKKEMEEIDRSIHQLKGFSRKNLNDDGGLYFIMKKFVEPDSPTSQEDFSGNSPSFSVGFSSPS